MQRGLDIRGDNRYEDESAKAGGKSEYLQRRESCPGSGAARDLYNFYLTLLLQKLTITQVQAMTASVRMHFPAEIGDQRLRVLFGSDGSRGSRPSFPREVMNGPDRLPDSG